MRTAILRPATILKALLPLASLALICCLPRPVLAEQRALVVGVGKLDIPNNDLPSIELDLERIHEMLNRMGFEDRQIHTLQDEAATSSRVIAEFNTWLTQGVQPDDRVVFYFSGHGSNIPDEHGDQDDNVSQVLVTHDVKFTRVKAGPSLSGVLPDFRISQLLAAIPSRNVLFIVDSCHSGTVTRSFSLDNHSLGTSPVYVKSLNYPGMPSPPPHAVTRGIATATERKEPQWDSHANYIAITAAADNQEAIGTMNGGVFTLGLTDAVKRLTSEGKSPTPKELRDDADAYIRSKVDKNQVHTPQIMGNQALADAPIKVIALNAANGPNRKRLLELVAQQPQHIDLTASSSRYVVDQPVKLTLKIPADGFLNVVSVDAKDNATVLFPNGYQKANAVSAGTFSFPTPQMAFDLLAAEPAGPTLVVAFLSSDPINFYQDTVEDRDEAGHIKVDFPQLSHTATRAIRVAPRSKDIYASQLDLQIVPAAAPAAAAAAKQLK
jgi:metacaspase-1